MSADMARTELKKDLKECKPYLKIRKFTVNILSLRGKFTGLHDVYIEGLRKNPVTTTNTKMCKLWKPILYRVVEIERIGKYVYSL